MPLAVVSLATSSERLSAHALHNLSRSCRALRTTVGAFPALKLCRTSETYARRRLTGLAAVGAGQRVLPERSIPGVSIALDNLRWNTEGLVTAIAQVLA